MTFGNAALTNTTATFSAPGVYTLELSADDGVHAVAYDAVVIVVTNAVWMSAARAGTNVTLNWLGGTAPTVVQTNPGLMPSGWGNMATTSLQSVSLPLTHTNKFFRIQSP